MRITVVGPCASGKTALAKRLRNLGYETRECTQEHSYVPTMWQKISRPDVLIYLDASLPVVAERRSADWSEEYLAKLNRRLSHARQHCDLYIQTDRLSEEEVLERALDFLRAFPLPVREGLGEGGSLIERSTPTQPPPARGRR
jgi:deoxyadenosine/deoxycytidine kinase